MDESPTANAVRALRAVILAGEQYRKVLSERMQLGITETQAISYLTVNGDRGQTDLATDLGITTSAATALIDRLEATGIATRYPHPHDRRRTLVRLTPKGKDVVKQSQLWLAAALNRIPEDRHGETGELLMTLAEDLRKRSEEVAAGGLPQI
ncbi:MAG TPA: MarR family winged helix-turn-helix transcriptional regulator [Propionibacteriaceae bacterium]|nr:MarR family winged helix-turn-helix transcriptional regulator [Propionibacteriaceae bacterium]